jgi:hypothetical protein
VIEGEMILELKPAPHPEDSFEVHMSPTYNQSITIAPYTNHKVSSEKGCKFIIYSSKIFDPKNPDTFTL